MATSVPEPIKANLHQRLTRHAETRWPALSGVQVRYHGMFAYIDGQLPDGVTLPLCRLRHTGSPSIWGFTIYLADQDRYEGTGLPDGRDAGTPEEVLDCACGLHLNDEFIVWLDATDSFRPILVQHSKQSQARNADDPASEQTRPTDS